MVLRGPRRHEKELSSIYWEGGMLVVHIHQHSPMYIIHIRQFLTWYIFMALIKTRRVYIETQPVKMLCPYLLVVLVYCRRWTPSDDSHQ